MLAMLVIGRQIKRLQLLQLWLQLLLQNVLDETI